VFDGVGDTLNQSLLAPLLVLMMGMLTVFMVWGVVYSVLVRIGFPDILGRLLLLAGVVFVFYQYIMNIETIGELASAWNVKVLAGIVIGQFVVSVILVQLLIGGPSKKQARKKPVQRSGRAAASGKRQAKRNTGAVRADDILLRCSFEELSGAEFERLLTLYFKDQGFAVQEVGVGGRDGGVDLVIKDRRGEKTAVQAKCYAEHNKVGVQIVRELVAAKRNHDCILSMLVTTSDLTRDARREAEQFKVDYWHGGMVESKLRAWGKWQPKGSSAKVGSRA